MSSSRWTLIALILALALAVSAAPAAAATLSGTVTGQTGGEEAKALPEVKVTVYEDPEGEPAATAFTDGSGKYSATLAPGIYEVHFDAYPPYESTVAKAVEVTESRVLNVLLTSSEAVTLTGTLSDNAGKPLAGAKVFLQEGPSSAAATTGEGGSFALSVLPGSYRLRVVDNSQFFAGLPRGFTVTTPAFELSEDESRELKLPPTSKLTVEVLGKEDEPIAGTSVTAPALWGSGPFGGFEAAEVISQKLTATTDEEGRAEIAVFTGGAPQPEQVGSVKPPAESGYGEAIFEVPAIEADTTVVAHANSETVTLTGTLSDNAGKPLAGAKVFLQEGPSSAAATTGEGGSFALSVLPGSYRLRVVDNSQFFAGLPRGFTVTTPAFELSEDESRELKLPPTSKLTVEVLGKEDEPIAGTSVTAPALWGSGPFGGFEAAEVISHKLTATTDKAGRAEIAVFTGGAPQPEQVGSVKPPAESGYGEAIFEVPAIEGDTTVVAHASSETVTLTGTLSDNAGKPLAGAKVFLQEGPSSAAATTGEGGSFALSVLPGSYRLRVVDNSQFFAGLPRGFTVTTPAFELSEDESRELKLPPTSKLTVEVLGKEDEPIAGTSVTAPALWGSGPFGGFEAAEVISHKLTATTDKAGRAEIAVFTGGAPQPEQVGSVKPPAESGYGEAIFEVPAIEADTTVVVRYVGGPEEEEEEEEEEGKDTVAPIVDELAIEPTSIDTSAEPQFVTVHAHITDDLSGFEAGSIAFVSPSGKQSTSSAGFERVGGTALNGDYLIPVGFEQLSESGVWTVSELRLSDAAGNERVLKSADLIELGLAHKVLVQSEIEDTKAPQLQALEIIPDEIDTTAAGRTVELLAHITDDVSGLASLSVTFSSPGGAHKVTASAYEAGGEPTDGTYYIPVSFPQGSESGEWKIASFRMTDVAGNEQTLFTGNFIELGLSHTVTISGAVDTVAPTVNEIGIEPNAIDTSSAKQLVALRAHIEDDLSGFASGKVVFTSPSGKELVSAAGFERYGGDALAGDYSVPLVFPQSSEPGIWSISELRLVDGAGNERVLDGFQLKELELERTVEVAGESSSVTLETEPNPSVYGQLVTFTAQVEVPAGSPAPLGTVAFVEGSNIIAVDNLNGKGVATYKTKWLGSGKHPIHAEYSGDAENDPAVSAAVTQVVTAAPTEVTRESDLNPAPYGASEKLTATVEAVGPGGGTPAGTITFREGETVLETVQLAGKTAKLSLKSLPLGEHDIIASYSGDPNHEPSNSQPLTQTIEPAASEVDLTSTEGPTPYGSAAKLKAKVLPVAPGGGTPDGTVTFREGETVLASVPLVNGLATYPLNGTEPGEYELVAAYSGNGNYTASDASIAQTVTKAATEIVLTSAANPAGFGASGKLKARLKAAAPGGGTPAGTVTFAEGETVLAIVPLVNGSATYPLSAFAVGTHEVTVSYAGGARYNPSEATIAQTITS